MVICKLPRDKNATKYAEFLEKGTYNGFKSEEEQQKLINETFYTDPKDIVFAITIANTYGKGLDRAQEIEIKEPFVKSILIDFGYLGYCASISLESLKTYLISKNEVSAKDMDSNFVLTVFLHVSS